MQAVRLHADLQRSREQLITAREEERRRLRRDLHDGLGPSLAAIAMQLVGGRLARAARGAARSCHETLEAQTSQALADIRRLVYELRPPALDELGLVSALREQGRRFGSLSVTIDADERFDDLPAALEVAIYRIASEAITNAARHGDATSCEVRLSVDDALDARGARRRQGSAADAARGRRPDVDARARNRARRHLYDRQRGRRRHARACPAARPRGGPVDPVRTLIADDHPVFRGGLRTLLAADEMVEIVGEATNGTEAVALAEELQPDVVVMDLQMPELNGIEATRQIVARSPHVGVLVLTMFEDDDSVFAAMRAGARGYLLKGAGPGEITRAIRAVGSGEAIFGPDVARRVMDYFTTPRPELAAMAFPELTDREREVLELIAQGRNNAVDRPSLRAEPEDDPQPRLEHLHEAAGRRPRRGDRAGARGGARPGRHALMEDAGPPLELTWLGGPEVEELALADDEILDAVEDALRAQGLGQTTIEPRVHLEPDPALRGHFNVLRGYVAPLGLAGVKIVGDYLDNYTRGLPSELGLLCLFDPTTGAPRRGDRRGGPDRHAYRRRHGDRRATSRAPRREGARPHRRPRHRVLERAPDRPALRARRDPRPLAPPREPRGASPRRCGASSARPVVVTDDWESCVRGADIVVEASRLEQPEPLLRTAWIEPGALVVPYGTMSAVELSLLEIADKVVVDDWGQCATGRLGALRAHVDAGLLTRDTLHAELGEIVAGTRPGRESPDETIVLWHRGLSLSDIALGHAMLEKARRTRRRPDAPLPLRRAHRGRGLTFA